MLREAVYHEIDSDYAYALSKRQLLIKLRTKKGDMDKVNLVYLDKYKYNETKETNWVRMKKVATDIMFDYYEAIVNVNINMLSVWYFFELTAENERVFYGNYKFFDKQPEEGSEVFNMPTLAEKDIFVVPEWARKSIVYQVFPERFCNGDKSLDPPNVQDWYSKVGFDSMLGGDIQGIINKLDYLDELGINTIYLTPIFVAGSNHKYNTYDYYKIDPQFGTLETLKELVVKAHEKNIKVILDAVFNHCGVDFQPFKDVLEHGEDSDYKHWFDIRRFPLQVKNDPQYATFGYHGSMPKLMTKNEEVKNYLISVATYWIKEANIDGWRLDVADEIDHSFWREFRKAVKAVKEDALIIGEVWYDSTSWLKGDQFDSVMNYEFQSAVTDLICDEKITSIEFAQRMGFLRGLYKLPAYNVLWNLIDSHDTARFLHKAKESIDKLKLAALMLLTLPGVPMLYYGDEVGMTGGPDPDCRRGMLWDENKQNKEVFEFYKKLIKLRKEHNALCLGDFITIYTDENLYGFRREYDMDVIDVYINNGEKDASITIESQKEIENLLDGTKYEAIDGKIIVNIPAKKGIVVR